MWINELVYFDNYCRTGGFPGSVTMAGAGPSGAVSTGGGFTTIYPVTECMEVGEGGLVSSETL